MNIFLRALDFLEMLMKKEVNMNSLKELALGLL